MLSEQICFKYCSEKNDAMTNYVLFECCFEQMLKDKMSEQMLLEQVFLKQKPFGQNLTTTHIVLVACNINILQSSNDVFRTKIDNSRCSKLWHLSLITLELSFTILEASFTFIFIIQASLKTIFI